MMVNLQGETQAQTLERMQRFADRIMPLAAIALAKEIRLCYAPRLWIISPSR